MVTVKLFVEGGGDSNELRSNCRQGFREFITKAGIKARPRIVASGSRNDAYDEFCEAVRQGELAILLIDSETPIEPKHQSGQSTTWKPWQHINKPCPKRATDQDCHLMVQVMESWLLLDRDQLGRFFGQGFKPQALPAIERPAETIGKVEIYAALQKATADCKTKAPYGKGTHSFEILKQIDPAKVITQSPWAKRFIDALNAKMAAAQ